MKKEDEFRSWLEQGGAKSPKGQTTRTYAIRTIERKLEDLGMPFRDLDTAWKADRFEALYERLRQMREDVLDGGQDYRILMPNSERPQGRISDWRSWLRQYGRFLDGEPPGPTKDADRVRQHVLAHYIEPARKDGGRQIDVLVSDVNRALGLNRAWPNICQALAGPKFQEFAQVRSPERIGPVQSPATIFRFSLRDLHIDNSALNKLRIRFLAVCPDFKSFVDPGTGRARDEKTGKAAASQQVRAAIGESRDDEALGKIVFEILKTFAKDAPLVRWQTEDSIDKQHPDLLGEFYAVIGSLIRSKQAPDEALSQANDSLNTLNDRELRH